MNITRKRLAEAATEADLDQRASQLLRDFFLDLASKADKDELDEWINATDANSRFFDLLLDVNREGTRTETIALLFKHTKRGPRKKTKLLVKILLYGVAVFLLVSVIDTIIPAHPITRWTSSGDLSNIELGMVSDTATDQPKIIWLQDSTRVELQPHSISWHPDELSIYRRKLVIEGSAIIEVRGSSLFGFVISTGDVTTKIIKSASVRCENGKITIAPPNPQPAKTITPPITTK